MNSLRPPTNSNAMIAYKSEPLISYCGGLDYDTVNPEHPITTNDTHYVSVWILAIEY